MFMRSIGLLGTLLAFAPQAHAKDIVTCFDVNGYNECRSPFPTPQLILQVSKHPCIVNNTWGYNPKTGYIWVGSGCKGVFGPQQGYHWGRDGGHDAHTSRYDDFGRYIGPHGVGALVDSPWEGKHSHSWKRPGRDEIDTTPQFDRNGNPNFDTHGNYIGPHGLGQLVDDPATLKKQ